MMNVVWKRPDGFHEASPQDFTIIEIANQAKIWLHKSDQDNYPFRVSGGWKDENATIKLNRLVNLLGKDGRNWLAFLSHDFNNSKAENLETYCSQLILWLEELSTNLKGDTWETDIMHQTFEEICARIKKCQTKMSNEKREVKKNVSN